MDTLKELTDMTVKINEAREVLTELKKTETEFIEKREKATVEKIQLILEKSENLLEGIRSNNDEIHQLYQTVSSYKEFLTEGHEKFKNMLTEFEERSELWDKKVENQYKEFGRIENQIKYDKKSITDDQNDITKAKEQIEKDKIKIADERQTLSRAIARLKENRI